MHRLLRCCTKQCVISFRPYAELISSRYRVHIATVPAMHSFSPDSWHGEISIPTRYMPQLNGLGRQPRQTFSKYEARPCHDGMLLQELTRIVPTSRSRVRRLISLLF